MLGAKLRALYQRRKGRDLFDVAIALRNPDVDPQRVVETFLGYMEKEQGRITRALYERNLAAKVAMAQSTADIGPMLAAGYEWDVERAIEEVSARLITLLPREPWKWDP